MRQPVVHALTACMLALYWVALGVAPGLAQSTPFEPFVGSYRSASTDEDARVIDGAISNGTADMGPLRRSIARTRLRAVNRPVANVRIALTGEQLITEYDGHRYIAPLDGRPARNLDPQGEPVHVTYQVAGRTLYAHYTGEDGSKDMEFTLSPNGSGLVLSVALESPKLPGPIRYQLAYVRQ